jgi:TetR/AcrR family tetracycline transcriptional repressor
MGRSRQTRGAGLNREVIVDAALALLDGVGLDGLTVRSLADELGVQSPALYWHFRSKQELLDAMADAVVQATGMGPFRPDEPWPDWLARRARRYRRSVLAHRDGARLVAGAQRLSLATVTSFNEELAALVDQGFTPTGALRTIQAISHYTTGFVLQEQAQTTMNATPAAEQAATLAALLDGGTSAPLVRALIEAGGLDGDEAFEHGLRALLDGSETALNHQLRTSRRQRPT